MSFTDIRVGDADAPDVEMERFRAEVELAPLLKGEVRIIQMAVERPRFHFDSPSLMANAGNAVRHALAARSGADLAGAAAGASTAARSSATAAPAEAGGPRGIDAVVEADSLDGPGQA